MRMTEIALANIEFLTGDRWAERFTQVVNRAEKKILLSVYMISHHWNSDAAYQLDMLETLKLAALRGVMCRGIVDQPNVQGRREPFNKKAAEAMQEAGWLMRKIPDEITLHEKIMVVDDRLTFIGSHNISLASACTNIDSSLAIISFDLANKVSEHFWQTWNRAVNLNINR